MTWPTGGPTTGSAARASVVEVIPHPQRDVALARITPAVVDVTPVALGTSLSRGEVLQVLGYGRTATDWGPAQAQSTTLTVDTLDATTAQATPAGTASLCQGDAGAPVVRGTSTRTELLALASTAWQKGCLGSVDTRTTATLTRLDDLTPWITQQTSSCWIEPEAGFTALHGAQSARDQGWRVAGGAEPDESRCELHLTGPGLFWYSTEHLPPAYTLRLDWQATSTHVDSGVLLGMARPGEDLQAAAARGVEVEIRPGGTGTSTSGALAGIAAPSENAQHPLGAWNTYEIGVAGRRVTVRLNGRLVNDQVLGDTSRLLTPGFVAIAAPGTGETLRLRNVRVRVDQPRAVFGAITGMAGKCLDVYYGRTDNSTPVNLISCHGGLNQMFTLPGDGTIRVQGRCLDSAGPANTTGGQQLYIWECNGTPAQQWETRPDGTLRATATDTCLDLPHGDTTDGTAIQLYTCHGDTNQQWTVPDSPASFGAITGMAGKCLDVYYGRTDNSTPVNLISCHGGLNQMFTLPGDGTIRVQGRCLDSAGPANTTGGRQLYIWECNGTPAQQWETRPDGTLRATATDTCLDLPHGDTTDGTAIQLYTCHGDTNQQWTVPFAS